MPVEDKGVKGDGGWFAVEVVTHDFFCPEALMVEVVVSNSVGFMGGMYVR